MQFGFGGYFNWFFDYFPQKGEFIPLASMSGEETAAVKDVVALMQQAAEATPHQLTEKAFIATGWPSAFNLLHNEHWMRSLSEDD
jgi:hypothetical protein